MPFRTLNHVIDPCQENGFRKFALKAMNKESQVTRQGNSNLPGAIPL